MQHELEPQHEKMYVSYLLDPKDPSMYSNTVRHPSLNLNHQNFVPPPQYTDFTGYHHVPGINNDPHHSQAGTWNPAYPPPREEWSPYGPGTTPTTSNPGQISFTPPDFSPVQPPGLLPPSINTSVGQLSPNSQRRNPYDWMRRSAPPSNPGNFFPKKTSASAITPVTFTFTIRKVLISKSKRNSRLFLCFHVAYSMIAHAPARWPAMF